MAHHNLKTWPKYFWDVVRGEKEFEVRKDDRNFAVGDTIQLQEWSPEIAQFTGSHCNAEVVYKLNGGQFGIADGYCVLGLRVDEPFELEE